MIYKKVIFLALTSFTITTNSIAMENSHEEEIPRCNMSDRIRLSTSFFFKGIWLKDRELLLKDLIDKNDPKDIALIQSLICSNTTAFRGHYKPCKNDGWFQYCSGEKALQQAIKNNNKPIVKTFFRYLDLHKGLFSKSGNVAEVTYFNIEFYYIPYYMEPVKEALETAINTSEEMTKLVLDEERRQLKYDQIPIYPENIKCNNAPGCEYYKKRLDESQENVNQLNKDYLAKLHNKVHSALK